MDRNHITDILDETPIGRLDESQLRFVRAHMELCDPCARAYEAASLVLNVIHERAVVTVEPSPFFATKVMAAYREQQANDIAVMLRLWRSARILVSSMALTTAALAVLSIVSPGPAVGSTETASVNPYSAESVILNDEADPLSYEQVISTIYADEEEAK